LKKLFNLCFILKYILPYKKEFNKNIKFLFF